MKIFYILQLEYRTQNIVHENILYLTIRIHDKKIHTQEKNNCMSLIQGKDSHYKMFWVGSKDGTGGVAIL